MSWKITCLLLLFIPQLCFGLSFDGISARPAHPSAQDELTKQWFIYKTEPGEQKQDAVIIKNESSAPVLLEIYSVDSTINEVGGLSLKENTDNQQEVGQWISFSERSFSLGAQEEKTIPFTLHVPENASAGEHYGGIIIQTNNEHKKQLQADGLQLPTKMALRVYVTIPGTVLKEAQITDFSTHGTWNKSQNQTIQTFSTKMENSGTAAIDAKLTVSYKNYFFGLGDHSFDTKFPLARGEVKTQEEQIVVPKLGLFKTQAVLSFEDQNGNLQIVYSPMNTFMALPWLEIIILLVIILIGIVVYIIKSVWMQFRKNRLPIYNVQEGDDILYVAEKTNTPWKKIVKYNGLKKPYVLVPGTGLFVHCLADEGEEIPVEGTQEEEESHEVETIVTEREEMQDITPTSPSKTGTATLLKILITFLVFVIIISVALLIYFGFQNKRVNFSLQKSHVANTPTEITLPEVTIESQPQEDPKEIQPPQEEPVDPIKPADITLHVYNGTKISGKARQLQQDLLKEGYVIPVIGNANQLNTGLTLVLHTAEQKAQAEVVADSLKNMGIDSVLTEDTVHAITIIIGNKGL